MNRNHLTSIIDGMTVEQLVKFYNDNHDPFDGIDMPRIYDTDNEWRDLVTDLMGSLDDLCQLKHILNHFDDADRYVCCADLTPSSWTTKEEMFDRFCSLDDMAEYFGEFEYNDLRWPED